MIVPMRRLTLLCLARESESTLETLRDDLGCVQLDLAGAGSQGSTSAKQDLSDAERAIRIIEKAFKSVGKNVADVASRSAASAELLEAKKDRLVQAVLAAEDARLAAAAEVERLKRLAATYEPFGDFDPESLPDLRANGISVTLARGGLREADVMSAGDGIVFRLLGDDGQRAYGAFIGYGAAAAHGTLPVGWEVVPPPPKSLSGLRDDLTRAETALAMQTIAIAATHGRIREIVAGRPALQMRIDFAAAEESISAQGPIAWITGWIPAPAVPMLRAKAVSCAWGLMVREPLPDENPPTLIRPSKLFRPMTALFQGLGISPAYSEADVSVPFMCYFSLFFAMLVGDGGYGAIILAATLWGWWKTKPKDGEGHRPAVLRSWLALLTVFSTATIGWGLLSNTWFGAGLPWCADWPTVKWLGDPSYRNMMLLCFTIGASHLVLARIWNGICRINDLSCLPEFGWAGILVFMYLVVNAIVGIFTGIPTWAYWMFGVSIALVVSKTRGVSLGMLPLNIMSALGDVISYVRLFAVGFASVQVAQNFNRMAIDMDLPTWAKIVPMVLVLLLGHALNFAMAGLSVLVHAVRLNTLEFSNHKGVTWSGSSFAPFRRHA